MNHTGNCDHQGPVVYSCATATWMVAKMGDWTPCCMWRAHVDCGDAKLFDHKIERGDENINALLLAANKRRSYEAQAITWMRNSSKMFKQCMANKGNQVRAWAPTHKHTCKTQKLVGDERHLQKKTMELASKHRTGSNTPAHAQQAIRINRVRIY